MSDAGVMIITIGVWIALNWIGVPLMWAGAIAIIGVGLFSYSLNS